MIYRIVWKPALYYSLMKPKMHVALALHPIKMIYQTRFSFLAAMPFLKPPNASQLSSIARVSILKEM